MLMLTTPAKTPAESSANLLPSPMSLLEETLSQRILAMRNVGFVLRSSHRARSRCGNGQKIIILRFTPLRSMKRGVGTDFILIVYLGGRAARSRTQAALFFTYVGFLSTMHEAVFPLRQCRPRTSGHLAHYARSSFPPGRYSIYLVCGSTKFSL